MNKNATRAFEAIYPLSPMQQGMLFHSLYAPASGVYAELLHFIIEGPLDEVAFEASWQQMVQRHSVLRTSFAWKRLEKMVQVVHRQVQLPLERLDWSQIAEDARSARMDELIRMERKRGFDLAKAPLFRLYLVKAGKECHHFVTIHHHTILDGWSMPILFKELLTLYEAIRSGRPGAQVLPAVRPYRDYIVWLDQQDNVAADRFWRKMLAGFAAPTPLVVDKAAGNGAEQASCHAEASLQLPTETTAALQRILRQNGLTFSTLLQGAWAMLLWRYSGEKDVVFGATVSGRPADFAGVENMVGLFINTIPVRCRLRPDENVVDWLKEIQAQQAEARQYEHSPLVWIRERSEVPPGQPLFESLLVFENYPVAAALREQKGSLAIRFIRSFEQTNYPLTVVSGPAQELPVTVSFDCRRFETTVIEGMLGHLAHILQSIAANPAQPIRTVRLLAELERQKVVNLWSGNELRFPEEQLCAHEWFEAQVKYLPDAVALRFEKESMSYAQLNERANQLARRLRKLGVGPETLVAICLGRAPEMIIALLAVLKAGGAFLPMDPSNPRNRLAHMLEDSGVQILVTQEEHRQSFTGFCGRMVYIDADEHLISREESANLLSLTSPENLAYVIYTSGSTGRPKGVLLQHCGLINMVRALGDYCKAGPESSVLQFSSFAFDAAVCEIFLALLRGGTLCLARHETVQSPKDLHGYMRENVVTLATLPPVMLRELAETELPALQTVVSVGEACGWDIADRWSRDHDFSNGYGPTEGTVASCLFRTAGRTNETTTVPIGRPLDNIEVCILDCDFEAVPVGIPGEICIGGASLARGYLNRPDLTAEKFVPHPFSARLGARLYRTGDLACYLPNGNLLFLGRLDHQVKLRGFRIELGEIEALLEEHPGVRHAIADLREDAFGEKRLVAYVVPRDHGALLPEDLQAQLAARLPQYMIPSTLVALQTLPLLPNGKVNRRALSQLDGSRPEAKSRFIPPRNASEELLAGIWMMLLGVPRVGVFDDFFECGGHSIRATQLLSRIRDVFGIELPVKSVFEARTLGALASEIERARAASAEDLSLPPLERVLRDQPLPLSFAQQRLWFLDQLQPGGTFYNISAAIRLRGKLDVCALDRCLQEIIRRHEVLRTTFTSVDGRPVQVIRESHKAELPIVDLSLLTETERETEVQRLARREMEWSFDLEKDCLFRTTLLHLGPEENAILLTTHHIVSDGWSMGILVREVSALYEAFHAGNPSPLFELPIQYADYACWQCQVLSGAHLARQLDFWKKQLGDAPRALELPTDRPRPATLTFRGGTESLAWSSEFSQQLSEFSRKQGVTPFMTMLAAFQSLLHRYSGQADIVVGSAVANRTNSKTEKLIGFFVNTLVLRGRFSDDPTFSELLRQLRRTCLDAYDHQDVPFERLVEELHPPRDLSRPPLFQVGFAFQNIPLEQLQLTGISLAPVEVRSTTAKYDLTLTVTEERRGLAAYLEYNADLYDAGTIRRMLEHLRNLLGSALHDPEQPVSCLPLMSERERHQVLDEWNSTQIAFPRDLRVHEWFEMEVAKRPSSIALEFESHKLSYGELNRCANQLARQLRRQGLTRGALAGICMDRSLEMVIGLMAILKAGSAFVPLDPAYPSERLKYMIHDAALAILLTRESLRAHLFGLAPTLFYVDSARDAISCESDENLEVDGCPDDLAYVIYTSGSTGRPKGTMVQHRSLCNLAQAQIEAFHVGGGSRILQFSSLSFDASVWETVMALLSGGTLCLARREVLSTGQGLHRLLSDQRITTVTLPPSVLAVLPEQELPDLELIITAGEQCTADLVSRWGRGRRFFNAYGPTETTVCASMLEVTEHYPQGPPIGRPIANTKIYVLDAKWWPVPVGVPGELCVGGISVARGYLHRSDLTAEKFIPDPFSLLAGARLYKTGDQARYRPDGKIEFLGRMDDQVKVRGFRIELGEIAALLSAHPEVRDGMVIVREDVPGDRRIVAYVVTTRSSTITPADLRGYVAAQLPDHMVPAAFVFLPAMPLTPNGKIDRNALPSPDHASLALQNPYAAPRDRVEEKLAEITAHLLGIERVGIHDNFFDLGGHSLLATQFISQVRAALHVDLPLRSLFETPTVAGLAQRVMKSGHTDASTIEPEIQKLGRGDRKIEDLLAELGRMSDQEAQTLLAEEARRAEEGDRGR